MNANGTVGQRFEVRGAVLIRKEILERIESGETVATFRKWKKLTVRAGGTLKTSVGVVKILKVEAIKPAEISEAAAKRDGYASKSAMLGELRQRNGQLYRITLAYGSADPRIALREDVRLSKQELADLLQKLERMDARSSVGPWVLRVLTAIRDNPMMPAVELAEQTGFEKDWLKTNVRKLKNLGLTVSHHPGYSLSPRGASVLKRL